MEEKKESITPQQVLYLLASPNWSQNKITKTFAISPRTVSAIVHGTYIAKQKGRKAKITEEHKLFIADNSHVVEEVEMKIHQRKKNRMIHHLNQLIISMMTASKCSPMMIFH